MGKATPPSVLTLMRGQVPVTSFLGSLGGTLRETRITAMLGYLIAHDPTQWAGFFSLRKPISSVGIEADYERDRADIVIETTVERVIVEAKVVWVDPEKQVEKYRGNRKIPIHELHPRVNALVSAATLRFLGGCRFFPRRVG